MGLTDNAVRLIRERYMHKGESVEGVFKRVAKALAIRDEKFEKELFNAMINGVFLPNSPCIRNAGKKKGSLSACFVLPIEDSIASIYQTLTNMAVIFQRGGGVGINFSSLRPEGFPLSSGGTSSGPISFMKIFDVNTEVIKQGGFRRGASLLALNCNHVDIEKFCQAKLKEELTNANLSVAVTDEFMEKAINGEFIDLKYNDKAYGKVNAGNVLDLMSFGAWVSGDPGILFIDRINKDNPRYPEIKIECTNPCGEVPAPPFGACVLGSINLAKFVKGDSFDWDEYERMLILGTRALLNINVINVYPLQQVQKVMHDLNSIGLGFMGFADALVLLGICYDSNECLNFIDELGTRYVEITDAIAQDSFAKRSIAPTGSLSILADCSSGIEPIFARKYERHVTVGVLEEGRDYYNSEFCRTAHEVSPEWHLKVQAKWTEYVDQGVSKTINCPSDTTVKDIRDIFIKAWRLGVKGITIFRDKSKAGVYKTKCEDELCTL